MSKSSRKNVDALLADTRLSTVKANENDSNLKVVLDALPTADDGSALGASLQQVILPKSKVETSDLTTISALLLADGTEDASTGAAPTSSFAFTANGDYGRMQTMFGDMERTIRPMNVQTLTMQGIDGGIRATVTGITYYSPEQSVQLGKKSIKP